MSASNTTNFFPTNSGSNGPASNPESNKLASTATSSAVITVVRDPEHVLGKTFSIKPDGEIDKQAAVSLSLGIAEMRLVESHKDLKAVLAEVGEDDHAAIINAGFLDVEIDEEFLILSIRQLSKRLGISRHDHEELKGVHTVEYRGRRMKAIARLKENVIPSCWQYLDRDIDEHTPAEFASMSFTEWRHAIAKFLPGFKDVTCLHVPSTSSRVLRDSKPIGTGNGHRWFRINDPNDIERFRTASIVQATQANMTWLKPRYSRIEPSKVIGATASRQLSIRVYSHQGGSSSSANPLCLATSLSNPKTSPFFKVPWMPSTRPVLSCPTRTP
jgi:hypothetical protein